MRGEAAREGERAGAPVVGHRALRLQQAGGWRGKGGQRRRGQGSDGRTRKPQKRTLKPQKITPKPQKCTPKPHFANLQKKTIRVTLWISGDTGWEEDEEGAGCWSALTLKKGQARLFVRAPVERPAAKAVTGVETPGAPSMASRSGSFVQARADRSAGGGDREDVALSYVYANSGCVAASWLCVL